MFLNELQGCLKSRTANIITHISESELEKSDRLQLKKERRGKWNTLPTNWPSQVTNIFPVPHSQSAAITAEEFQRECKEIKTKTQKTFTVISFDTCIKIYGVII